MTSAPMNIIDVWATLILSPKQTFKIFYTNVNPKQTCIRLYLNKLAFYTSCMFSIDQLVIEKCINGSLNCKYLPIIAWQIDICYTQRWPLPIANLVNIEKNDTKDKRINCWLSVLLCWFFFSLVKRCYRSLNNFESSLKHAL